MKSFVHAVCKLEIAKACSPLLCGMYLVFCTSTAADAEILFTPRISAGTIYTDNVFLSPTDEEWDVITFVSPGISLDLSGRNSRLALVYDPAYMNYTRFPNNTYWRHTAHLDGWAEITRNTRLELTNDYRYTSDAITATDTTVRQGGKPFTTNTAIVGIVNHFGPESFGELRYKSYILENDDETIEDSAYHQPNFLITYWFVPRRYALEVEGKYTISEFDVSEDFEDLETRFQLTRRFGRNIDGYLEYSHTYFDYHNEGEDFRVYSPKVGFDYQERADTRFGASFGFFYRDNEISEDDDGIVATLETAYNYATQGSFTLNGAVGYDLSFFRAQNLGFNPFYEVKGDLSQQFTRRLFGELEAGYRRNLYIDQEPDREDALWVAGAGLGYRALPWLTFKLHYRYRQVNSNINEYDYIENRGMLSVTLAPQTPMRF